MVTIKFHRELNKDIYGASQKEKEELFKALSKINCVEDILEKSEPVNLEQMKKEEPELYNKLMSRLTDLKKYKEAQK